MSAYIQVGTFRWVHSGGYTEGGYIQVGTLRVGTFRWVHSGGYTEGVCALSVYACM